ncbi:peptidoglycan-binding protein [Luteimonas sp. WGS1318]|uniref:peptidoglycan-binding protein n=1 Tax=Luteimonas sp. WGS1318 TaxID=3366815 RepID=UPI00372CF04E
MRNPLHDLMYRGESGAAGYNAFNRGTYIDAGGRERIRPGEPPTDFSKLSVGALQDLQHLPRHDPDRVFAVGKYQIIPSTMDAAVARLGITRDMPFTPELQDRIFTDYLLREKQPAVRDYIMGVQRATREQAQLGLAREWASFGDPLKEGRSYYGGANRAHITLEQSADALDRMREAYARASAHGLSRDDAWHAATAIEHGARTQSPSAPARSGGTVQSANALLQAPAQGEAVRALQTNLVRLDYAGRDGRPLSTDGHFGPDTAYAVRMFQRDQGLDVDGIAGPKTLGSVALQLESCIADKPGSPVDDLLNSLRSGGDAIREATERLVQSQAGQQWRDQVEAATRSQTEQARCASTSAPEADARGL